MGLSDTCDVAKVDKPVVVAIVVGVGGIGVVVGVVVFSVIVMAGKVRFEDRDPPKRDQTGACSRLSSSWKGLEPAKRRMMCPPFSETE